MSRTDHTRLRSARSSARLRALAFAVAVGVCVPLLSACSGGNDAKGSQSGNNDGAGRAIESSIRPALTVTAVKVALDQLPVRLSAYGSIGAWQEASIGAEVGGLRVSEVLVDVGDEVHKDQTLAVMSPTTMANSVAAQQAQIAEARAGLNEARANVDRANKLRDSGAISTQQIQQYETAKRTAEARLQAMEANMRTERTRLGQTKVLASDDGVISQRMATVGSVAQPGQELFRLIRQGRLEWRAEVPSSELYRIHEKGQAELELPGGAKVAGTVRAIAPTVDAATRNGIVHVDLEKPKNQSTDGSQPRAGMFARGSFLLGEQQVRTLPVSAILHRDGFAHVFRIEAMDKSVQDPKLRRVRLQKVQLGAQVGERVEIRSGVEDGVFVASNGVGFLVDGDIVSLTNP